MVFRIWREVMMAQTVDLSGNSVLCGEGILIGNTYCVQFLIRGR